MRLDLVAAFRWAGAAIFSTALLAVGSTVASAQDAITTTTGDKLVGEIQKLEKDVLTFSTGYSDSDFKIEWDKIVSIESSRQFLVETFGGLRLSGSLKADPAQKATMLIGNERVPLADVSVIQPYERSFWSRFDMGFDFGYSQVSANSAKQFTLGGNLSYRDEKSVDSLFASVFRSSQSDAPRTQRWELGNDYRYLLGQHWYVNTTQDFLNSDDQGLSLRTSLGGGGGRYLLQSASQYLAAGAGVVWTREDYQDPAVETRDSAELYFGTEFMTERLTFADLLTRFTYFPSLTIDNRYRITYKFDLDFNLPGDWFFRIGIFENYDSQPPPAVSKHDAGWSTSFGLKF